MLSFGPNDETRAIIFRKPILSRVNVNGKKNKNKKKQAFWEILHIQNNMKIINCSNL
jgi:hypothetical protein